MTATEIAVRYVASLYRDLTIDQLAELRSDEGIGVSVNLELGTADRTVWPDGGVPDVVVWHREDDDMIVACTVEDPEDGEEWFELPASQFR